MLFSLVLISIIIITNRELLYERLAKRNNLQTTSAQGTESWLPLYHAHIRDFRSVRAPMYIWK